MQATLYTKVLVGAISTPTGTEVIAGELNRRFVAGQVTSETRITRLLGARLEAALVTQLAGVWRAQLDAQATPWTTPSFAEGTTTLTSGATVNYSTGGGRGPWYTPYPMAGIGDNGTLDATFTEAQLQSAAQEAGVPLPVGVHGATIKLYVFVNSWVWMCPDASGIVKGRIESDGTLYIGLETDAGQLAAAEWLDLHSGYHLAVGATGRVTNVERMTTRVKFGSRRIWPSLIGTGWRGVLTGGGWKPQGPNSDFVTHLSPLAGTIQGPRGSYEIANGPSTRGIGPLRSLAGLSGAARSTATLAFISLQYVRGALVPQFAEHPQQCKGAASASG